MVCNIRVDWYLEGRSSLVTRGQCFDVGVHVRWILGIRYRIKTTLFVSEHILPSNSMNFLHTCTSSHFH